MDQYAQVLLIAIPVFLILMVIEALYSWWIGNLTFNSMDTISSLSSGSTNTLKSVLKLSIVIISYSWLSNQIGIFDIDKSNWLPWVISFIAIDFAGYWSHRLNHSINIFWNRHIVHHSSEEFNLACALRQSISELVSLGFIFLFPAALIGIPGEMIAVIAPIHLFMQFWYHTQHIPKLGWLEYIIVTPSQHRVHHAINDVYLDKNLSPIFCLWDRLFGTFQEELEDVPCVYGVKRAVATWNPIRINFQHLWLLIKDAWRAEHWIDKLKIWFMPTGWRPKDVALRYPVDFIEDPKTQIKYQPKASFYLHAWSWIQYLLMNLFLVHLLVFISKIGFPALFLYGGFIFAMIYSYSSLMDGERSAIWFEIFKSVLGIGIIWSSGDWFFINDFIPGGLYLVSTYLILSVVVVLYFVKGELTSKPLVDLA